MEKIRANSILPARREDIELQTADGLTLVGELARPADRDPAATIVCLHPLPTHGGMMDSHVFRKAAWRLPALAGVAVLRFNTRGTSSVRGPSPRSCTLLRSSTACLKGASAGVIGVWKTCTSTTPAKSAGARGQMCQPRARVGAGVAGAGGGW